MKKEKYIKPKIKEKKIKPSCFLIRRKSYHQEEGLLFASIAR